MKAAKLIRKTGWLQLSGAFAMRGVYDAFIEATFLKYHEDFSDFVGMYCAGGEL